MKSKHIIAGMAALTIGAAFTSCSHDFEYDSIEQQVLDTYNRIFIETFGEPAADQDWGFGTATTKGLTRAVFTDKWTNDHSCNWESKFSFEIPANAVDLTKGSFTDAEKSATEFVIPASFNGELNFNYAFNIPAGAKIYNRGKVTSINGVNYNGVVTFYNVNELGFGEYNGGRHTVINTGVLTVFSYGNIGHVYNKGTLVLERTHNPYYENIGGTADVSNETHIYSNGEGSVMMPDGGDMKAVCDIHGTLYVGNRDQNIVKNVKIQNSTTKYICGIDCTGKVENVDGPLITSFVKADLFTFDGNPIYLLPGGHVDVTTLQVPNSNCHVYGHKGSVALIEATNFEFGNKNDFTHTFSNNIYFKVNGGYIKVDNCYAMGQSHYFNNVADYLADTTHADEFALAADRVNAGNATGSPACGSAWSIGTPDDGDKDEEWDEWARIIVEDLSATSRTDFDFNDAVFDVRINSAGTKAQILLKAAGGTLPLTIGWSGEEGTSYSEFEVHNMYGVATNVMVNTNATNGVNGLPDVPKTLTGTFKSYDDIKVMVCKRGEWITIEAFEGEPAGKIRVKPTYEWCKERRNIYDVYNGEKAGYRKSFLDYVKDPNVGSSWYEK